LWSRTTNPPGSFGSGLVLARNAGAALADLEFTQFHPTAVTGIKGREGFLISEAVRGEGATLHGPDGERFVDELAPRDAVARAIFNLLRETGTTAVELDMTMIDRGRFPNIVEALQQAGLDPTKQRIPVSPASHYVMGGIVTDLDGRARGATALYAIGECACTGLHGANRLASNSLLEGLVMGRRAARAAAADLAGPRPLLTTEPAAELAPRPIADRDLVQRAMTAGASIGRDGAGLAAASDAIESAVAVAKPTDRRGVEDAALTLLGQAVLAAAGTRTESRGCHVRTDFPRTDDTYQHSSLQVALVDGRPVVRAAELTRRAGAA
ncbi:MAG TPA: FAD-binding protein, partial [Pseudonocardia sp.]|nr:FAD-binding protein [Pseudonocardia sp.]